MRRGAAAPCSAYRARRAAEKRVIELSEILLAWSLTPLDVLSLGAFFVRRDRRLALHRLAREVLAFEHCSQSCRYRASPRHAQSPSSSLDVLQLAATNHAES